MRLSRLAILPLCTTALFALTACPGEPPKYAEKEARPVDEWEEIQRTAEWLIVTRGFSGSHEAECKAVLEWVKGEEGCRGKVCAHGRDLSKEWAERCKKLVADDLDDVEELRKKFESKAREPESDCSQELGSMLREGCGKDEKTCSEAAERWATRCGKEAGSPLAVRMLERAVERKMAEPKRMTLDPRPCGEVAADVVELSKCGQMFECQEAEKKLEGYERRCLHGDARAPAVTAAAAIALQMGAQTKGPKPWPLAHDAHIKPDLMRTALADGSGAALSVCDKRVLDLASYVEARRACQGKVTFARAFKDKGAVTMMPGSFEIASERELRLGAPSLMLAGEKELEDKAAIDKLGASLASASTPKQLIEALSPLASMIMRSAEVKKALAAKDEQLVTAMRELGKAKATAAKAKMSGADLAGFMARSRARAFADLKDSGDVEPGAQASLELLETAALLPRSHAAYLEGWKPAERFSPRARVDKKTAELSKQFAQEQIKACAEAEKTIIDSQAKYLRCGFGLEGCEAGLGAVAKAIDEARAKAEGALHMIELVKTGPASADALLLGQKMDEGGCKEAWW